MKLAEQLDSLRLIPRAIALALAGTAIYLTLVITHAIVADGIDGGGELAVVAGIITGMITASTALVGMLSGSENKK